MSAHPPAVDAVISFGNGLSVKWNGKELGNIKMDNVSITGDAGGDINVTSSFEVADTDYLTEFTKVSLFSVCTRGSADLFADPDHRGLL